MVQTGDAGSNEPVYLYCATVRSPDPKRVGTCALALGCATLAVYTCQYARHVSHVPAHHRLYLKSSFIG